MRRLWLVLVVAIGWLGGAIGGLWVHSLWYRTGICAGTFQLQAEAGAISLGRRTAAFHDGSLAFYDHPPDAVILPPAGWYSPEEGVRAVGETIRLNAGFPGTEDHSEPGRTE